MLKRLVLATALFASSAWAQQELSLTAKDIESGAADAKLAELGRQASVTGREVVINAPKEWHSKVAAKVKAGGKADVKLNDSFFENVVVRVSDKAAPPPAAAPAPTPAPPKPVEAPKPAAPAKPAEAPKPAAAPPPKPVEPTPAPEPVQTPAPAPVEPTPVAPPPPVEAPKPAPAAAAPVDPSVAVRQRLIQSLNEGRPVSAELDVSQLQKGDTIYIEGSVRAVVRRDRLKTALHWLAGELNLKRSELRPLGENRYEVLEPLAAGDNISLRNDPTGAPQLFTGKLPGDADAERLEMEKAYAEGRTITRSARADQLKQGDILYLGKSAGVVVRRDGTTLVRYWLDGAIDLNQRGLQKEKDSTSKYRVLSDNIR